MASAKVVDVCRSLSCDCGVRCGVGMRWLGFGIVIFVVEHVKRGYWSLHRDDRRYRYLLRVSHGDDHNDANGRLSELESRG
jgi:hypothetical protein